MDKPSLSVAKHIEDGIAHMFAKPLMWAYTAGELEMQYFTMVDIYNVATGAEPSVARRTYSYYQNSVGLKPQLRICEQVGMDMEKTLEHLKKAWDYYMEYRGLKKADG